MSRRVITLLTDFGLTDPLVGIVKGVILGINPEAECVDLTHDILPQDILAGALALEAAVPYFPRGTTHLAVVDPGVGGERRPLVVEVGGHAFVGPDNGLFTFLWRRPGVRAVACTNPVYHLPSVSRTFHARDLFAPVAAHLSLGVPLARLGPPVEDPVELPWPSPRDVGDAEEGEVLHVDRFGNLITNLTLPGSPEGRGVVLEIAGLRIEGLAPYYAATRAGEVGAIVGSTGRIEIFVNRGNARDRLGVGRGAPVRLTKSPKMSWGSSPQT